MQSDMWPPGMSQRSCSYEQEGAQHGPIAPMSKPSPSRAAGGGSQTVPPPCLSLPPAVIWSPVPRNDGTFAGFGDNKKKHGVRRGWDGMGRTQHNCKIQQEKSNFSLSDASFSVLPLVHFLLPFPVPVEELCI